MLGKDSGGHAAPARPGIGVVIITNQSLSVLLRWSDCLLIFHQNGEENDTVTTAVSILAYMSRKASNVWKVGMLCAGTYLRV